MVFRCFALLFVFAVAMNTVDAQLRPAKKRILAIGEVKGYQHDSVSDALGTFWKMGRDTRLWDTYIIDGVFVNGPAFLSRALSYPARLVQWGLVQWYALVMVAGLLGFLAYYTVK